MLNTAQLVLRNTKCQLEQIEKQSEAIPVDYRKKMERIHVDVAQITHLNCCCIQLLRDLMSNLSNLTKNWIGLERYFESTNNVVKVTVTKKLAGFGKDAAKDAILIEFLENSILDSSRWFYSLVHQNANAYVRASDRYVLKNVAGMANLMSLPSNEIEGAQNELKNSCQEACDGISAMAIEDNGQGTAD